MNPLRRLDDRFVPALAAFFDRLIPPAPEPSGPLPVIVRLRRWDDRYAGTGLLGFLREVPQMGAVALAALVFTSSVTVYSRTSRTEQAAREDGTGSYADDGPLDGELGPDIGTSVDGYLDETKERLRRVAAAEPDAMAVAVVMLNEYRTPEQVRDLLGPVQARVVFYKPPTPEGVVRQIPVEDLVGDTRADMTRYAADSAAEAKELARVGATIEGDPAGKRQHLADAKAYAAEAKVLRGPCECVFAVVVRAQVRMLADALNLGGVRTIEVSGLGARIERFTLFTALLPDEKVTVTGGNEEPAG